MLLLRLLVFTSLIGIGLSFLLYLFTRDSRYLKFTWALVKFVFVFLIGFAAFYVLERLVLI